MKRYFFPQNKIRNKLLRLIADTINEYYPIGLNTFTPEYHQYPGIIKANEIISKNIGPPEQSAGLFAVIWRSLLKELRETSAFEIIGTTYGFVPGFSADLILEKFEDESLIRTKRITFAVSMLGPYFSICGIDETFIKEKENGFASGYHAINVVTSSPYKEFENSFLSIKILIEKHFPEYYFIAFETCMLFIKDVETQHSMGQEGTIYNALFNHLFNFYTHFRSRGDTSYGYEKDPNFKIILTAPPGT